MEPHQPPLPPIGIVVNTSKNRDRELPSFANINLLGRCNVDCFFCLGKDLKDFERFHDNKCLKKHFSEWKRFWEFLSVCTNHNIRKIYITGQNTDSLLYPHLDALISELQGEGFGVGLRTNGYLAPRCFDTINKCDLSVGYSLHTLNPITNKMIMGRADLPPIQTLLTETLNPRVSIVLNRCNQYEFFELLRFLSEYRNRIKYVQVRRVSTDTRLDLLMPDLLAYEQQYSKVREIFPIKRTLWGDADEFEIYNMPVVFWRTIKTSVNSFNYFIDGTISEEYFVVEGYLKHRENSGEEE